VSSPEVVWAVERTPNPAVVRIHTRLELTKRTIATFPPGSPGAPLDLLLMVPGVRSIDVHRYRVRVNLTPEGDADAVAAAAAGVLMPAWGREVDLPEEAEPRVFPISSPARRRRAAESLEMAGDDRLLSTLFRVHGVEEGIVDGDRLTVRPGRLFSWERIEPGVLGALEDAG
jgi:hypothetical protein